MTKPQPKGAAAHKPAHAKAVPSKPPAAKAAGPKKSDEPAKYQPTKHDRADKRIHGRMKGDENDPRLRCPKDSTYMEKVTVGGIEIDRCAGCGALWFDALELDKVLSGAHAKDMVQVLDIGSKGRVSGGRALGGVVCPRDRSPLITVVDPKQSHIEESACTVCGGVLLDAGELKDLSEFTLGERVKGLFARLKRS